MDSVEQAAYFWSYIVLENSSSDNNDNNSSNKNQFDEYGMEHPFQGMIGEFLFQNRAVLTAGGAAAR